MFGNLFGASDRDTDATLTHQAAVAAGQQRDANGRAAARAARSQRSVGGGSGSTPHGSIQQRAYNPRGRDRS